MPWYASDGVLWLAVILGSSYAYFKIPDTLNHIRNLAACPEQRGSGPRKQLQKDAEDAINIDTLRVLSDSHSYDLRNAAIKIVASRTVKSRAKRLLLRDLISKDAEKQRNAVHALRMLLLYPALHGGQITNHFVNYETFFALITALKRILPDHEPNRNSYLPPATQKLYPEPKMPPSPVRVFRSQQEVHLMEILQVFLNATSSGDLLSEYPDNMTCALSAGLVHRWLKHYPFPCALPQNSIYNFKKSDVSNLFEKAWKSDDPIMANIMNSISATPLGKKHLREAGLCGSSYTEIEDIEDTVRKWRHVPTRLGSTDMDRDVRMINGESTAGAATPPPVAFNRRRANTNRGTSRARSQEISREEETLRRRRREAVVVAEAGAPLSQNNILQRMESGHVWRPIDRVSEPPLTVADDMTEFPSFSFGTDPVGSPDALRETNTAADGDPWSLSSDTATSLEAEDTLHGPSSQPPLDGRAATEFLPDGLDRETNVNRDDFVDRISGVLDRIHQHRDHAREALNQQYTQSEAGGYTAEQLDTVSQDPVRNEQTDTLLSILRPADPETDTRENDESPLGS